MSLDDDMRAAVDERLAETIRRNRERQDNRRRRLAELSERRRHGLQRRHRDKLNRNQEKAP
ncbi:hypothetical protein [Actinomadura rudentiformis]|uniref:Uncharacterized protein n=1 Tax=Actinomadura rudentiformis TaxID=359158 RepID=A0A6H9YRG0_9ACTN|nr:hypothetical protein [Actinomadura rudentiformis]KAB2341880.1 hypothetical protein F8566_40595 [Actinomadura rudentiformis]